MVQFYFKSTRFNHYLLRVKILNLLEYFLVDIILIISFVEIGKIYRVSEYNVLPLGGVWGLLG